VKTSDATVVRAIQALGFAGLRDLKQTLEQWFGPVVTSSEKMSTTVNTLASDVNASIDFVLEGHQHTCEVLSEPHNRYAMAQAVSLLAQARQVAIFGIGASGILAEYTARLFSRMGLPATPLNRTGIGLAEQLIALQRGDVLVMMAQKSAHREGQTTLREAKRLGIPTILLTNAPILQQGGQRGDPRRAAAKRQNPAPRHGAAVSGDDYFIRRLHRAAAHHQVDEAHQRVTSWVKAGEEKQRRITRRIRAALRIAVCSRRTLHLWHRSPPR
jgi:hypothetical protein